MKMKKSDYLNRAKELVSQMTIKEKVGQLSQTVAGYRCFERLGENFIFKDDLKEFVAEYGGIGAISNILRADGFTNHTYGTGIELRHRVKVANALQRYVIEHSRLKIPVLIEVEANHGLQALDSEMFPTGIGMGCTFNPELYGEIMHSVGKEIQLSGNHIGFVTMLDIARDPRWGRVEEFFSEDPYLVACFTENGVRGIRSGGALACCKHYCATGDCMGGLNTAEVNIGKRELHDIHLPAVKAAVDSGAEFIMAAYNTVDGIPCHMNKYLLRDVLRDELGFDGVVLSDGFGVGRAIGQMGYDEVTGSAAVLKAGVDLSLADGGWYLNLVEAVKQGIVEESLVDEAVIRILIKKFELGLFDNPYIDDEQAVCRYVESGEQAALSYEAAAESLVLLKNNGILPLKTNTEVALFGEHADNIYYLLGDYTAYQNQDKCKTLRNAFMETFDNVFFANGWSFDGNNTFDDALSLCDKCDIAVVTIGGSSARALRNNVFDKNTGAVSTTGGFIDCGEARDVAGLKLPGNQVEFVRKLKEKGKKIVAVLIGGRPYELTEISVLVDAVVVAWYPGTQGAKAITDALVGRVNPSGKLSVSMPYSSSVLPAYYNSFLPPPSQGYDTNTYCDYAHRVLYPFGYGLSYSNFEYLDMNVTKTENNNYRVAVTLRNNSNLGGSEVVQLYIHGKGNSVRRRYRELKGFKKIFLEPKAQETVVFTLGYEELKVWSANEKYELENGTVELFAGSNPNLPLRAEITI